MSKRDPAPAPAARPPRAAPGEVWVAAVPSPRIALWDVDPAHPAGEVLLCGTDPRPQRVAETPRVLRALQEGRLVRVPAPAAPEA